MVERRREHEHRDRRLHCCRDHDNGGNNINGRINYWGTDNQHDIGTDDDTSDYVVVRRSDLDNLAAVIGSPNYGAVADAAEQLVNHANISAVDSAGDRMPRPANNPLQRLRALRDAYTDARAMYESDELPFHRVIAAQDALVAALRESPGDGT